ncbi:hypothetical protein PCASD_25779 [Puccinia coronata f. sp. avenae]|uniref:Uncharacterized protein n=1 Tax=Puccinia coronata f. sp. avenae TaxID=200324 RepID=A0A2N5S2H5_9BASI|nr:hypothetical protein PCASD_25779 [Puccinia coronata f. sp. avenae]
MLSTASRPIGGKDNLPKRHTAWPNLQPQNIEAARGSNPHQKHQAAGLGTTAGFLLTHFSRNELGSNAAIGAPLLCPCTDTETEDGPGAELSPTPGRSYVAPSRPVAALGRYQAACARLSLGPACDDSGYRRITVAHPFRPGDPWRRRGGMGTGSGTVSQVAPLLNRNVPQETGFPQSSLPTTFAKPIFPKGLDVVSQSGEKPDPASTLGDQAELLSNKEAVNKAVQVE